MSRGNPAQADVLDLFRQEAEAQAQVLTAGLLALERTQTAPDPHHAHVDPSGSRDARAERFRISVCAPPIDTPDGTLSVTISIGVAATSGVADGEALLRRADEALYRAKHAGGNRTEVQLVTC